MTRPLIAVATPARITPAWPFLALAVWLAGGRPRRLPPGRWAAERDRVHGIIVGGGSDIGAEIYGSKAVLDTRVDVERDAAERALVLDAWPTGMPVLGICRGAQMMNVARGGTLHGDIHAVYVTAPRMWTPLPLKHVHVLEETELARITRVRRFRVNSLHHQSVDRLGEGLSIAARDEAGIVQAIEAAGPTFRLGVQWHPEFLPYKRTHRRLFRAFIEAAARFARTAERTPLAA